MKPKLQAQRKFAQGAFIPPAPSYDRRAAAEPPAPENGASSMEVNLISNKTCAAKILDTIAFSHPGMHIHQPRVVLQRLETKVEGPFKTAVKKYKEPVKKSNIILRSMTKSEENNSDDDRPLMYHLKRKQPEDAASTTNGKLAGKRKKISKKTTVSKPSQNTMAKLKKIKVTRYKKNAKSTKVVENQLEQTKDNADNSAQENRSIAPELPSEQNSDEGCGPLYFSNSDSDEDFGPLYYSSSDSSSSGEGLRRKPAPSTSMTSKASVTTGLSSSTVTRNESVTNTPPGTKQSFAGVITKAPIYYPTEEEFSDPLAFYEKISPEASKFGLCKVVPPANFKPECNLTGLDRVLAGSQYPARFLMRWGEGTRDLCAIRSYLSTHNVHFLKPPLVDGLELNLPKMYRTVKKYGGFSKVTHKKKWSKVAEDMNLSKLTNPDKKLDQIYVKYLLPYDILTIKERNSIIHKVENRWRDSQTRLQKRARNPLHMRKVYFCESDESSDEGELSEDERNLRKIILDEEECVKPGRFMTPAIFRKVNNTAVQMFFPSGEPTVDVIEAMYWQTVQQATDHVCVYTASVDTSDVGFGFTTDPTDPTSQHAWNLKNVRKNDANILRSLGAVVSTTVPILHFGMFFSTNCWHRDPHGLPWIEFLHNAKPKIWYGIPDTESEIFRQAVERLCPTAVQNKPIWLPSDICMIPPSLLLDEGVNLTRVIQEPGEYIFIFPKAYSSSICTGFTISESVYFAVKPWHRTLPQVFKELRDSCEPMMFAEEQLLIAMAQDDRVPLGLLTQIYSHLVCVVNEELQSRLALVNQGIPKKFVARQGGGRPWNVSEEAECDVCRRPLFLSKVTVKGHHKSLRKMCPQDAHQILDKLSRLIPARLINLTLEIFVSDEELQEILSTARNRLIE